MHYDFDIELPPLTSKANMLKFVRPVSYGILKKVSIYFRGGCADLAHVKIYRWERQIFPTNNDGDYAYDDYTVEFEEYYPILETPFNLTIYGWNDDDTFQHTISFMFLILHPEVLGRPELRPTTEEELTELLGEYEMAGVI